MIHLVDAKLLSIINYGSIVFSSNIVCYCSSAACSSSSSVAFAGGTRRINQSKLLAATIVAVLLWQLLGSFWEAATPLQRPLRWGAATTWRYLPASFRFTSSCDAFEATAQQLPRPARTHLPCFRNTLGLLPLALTIPPIVAAQLCWG